jgi:NAD(P)-dependent dehydrogenase (short-subunit alcohol dehydrogenase family)
MIKEISNTKPVCLITGGSSGIGLATAKLFAAQGYHLAICGRNGNALSAARESILAETSDDTECLTLVADLNDIAQAKKIAQDVIDHFGHIEVLVNNAGAAPLAPFEEISAESFEAAINTNIRSVFYLTQAVWKQMKQQLSAEPSSETGIRAGIVVNVSSLAAVDPFPGFSVYGACKAWLDLITVALAEEGKELGLRVCSVRPGAVETPMLRSLFPDYPEDQCLPPEAIAEVIMACVSEPDEWESGAAFGVTADPPAT